LKPAVRRVFLLPGIKDSIRKSEELDSGLRFPGMTGRNGTFLLLVIRESGTSAQRAEQPKAGPVRVERSEQSSFLVRKSEELDSGFRFAAPE